jgi:hypothetical protein
MTDKRVVPVAYVTKWALTRGVLVVRGASLMLGADHNFANDYLKKGHLFVGRKHWTENREEAVTRWRKALEKEHKRLLNKAEDVGKRLLEAPPFTEET